MTKIFHGFRFAILIVAVLPLSCATTTLQPVNSLSRLDETNSIVFGKIEYWKNDKLMIKPAQKYSNPEVEYQFSRYVSDGSVETNLCKAGEYGFKIPVFRGGINDSYFWVVVPPGKYYFVELDYLSFFPDHPILGMRTYAGRQPCLMTFEAIANQAVYIGTLQNKINTQHDNLLYFEITMETDITNEFEATKEWFLKSNPKFKTNVVEEIVKIRRLSK